MPLINLVEFADLGLASLVSADLLNYLYGARTRQMFHNLSNSFREQLRRFLSAWIVREPPGQRLPRDLIAALRDVDEAEARNDCRAVGKARQRLRKARHDGLAREVESMSSKRASEASK